MGLPHKGQAVILSPAEVPGAVVMKNLATLQQDHRVAGVSARERLANDHIAGLRITGGNRVKAICRHIFDVEVFST